MVNIRPNPKPWSQVQKKLGFKPFSGCEGLNSGPTLTSTEDVRGEVGYRYSTSKNITVCLIFRPTPTSPLLFWICSDSEIRISKSGNPADIHWIFSGRNMGFAYSLRSLLFPKSKHSKPGAESSGRSCWPSSRWKWSWRRWPRQQNILGHQGLQMAIQKCFLAYTLYTMYIKLIERKCKATTFRPTYL